MVNRRNLLWLIPLFLLISFPVWRLPLTSFLEPRGGYDADFSKRDKDAQNFSMDAVTIVESKAGRKTAEIRAEKALTSEIADEFVLTSVDADIYDENDEKIHIVAKTGVYNSDSRQLTLIDKVRVTRYSNNQRLFSDLLYYYDQTRKIKSPGKTRLVGENIEIRGNSLDYDILTNQYLISGRVYCTIEGFSQP